MLFDQVPEYPLRYLYLSSGVGTYSIVLISGAEPTELTYCGLNDLSLMSHLSFSFYFNNVINES